MSDIKPDQWAIVELFGHQKIAGKISEQTMGGGSYVRVDVPAYDNAPAFTKLYGNAAIYAISFVTEEIATAAAKSYKVVPVSTYEIPELKQLRLPATSCDEQYDIEPNTDYGYDDHSA